MLKQTNEITNEVEQTERSIERELPEPLAALERLSNNYWWSWSADGPAVFRDLDPQLWEEREHNPRRLLREVPELRLMQMASDPSYAARVRRLAADFDEYMSPATKTWARGAAPTITAARPVAYFCAEYGIHTSLPLYSGGLGMLSGDHLKSASDVGLPLVGVGLLYCYGYFRQRLTVDGWQEEHYGGIDPADLPIFPVYTEAGQPLHIEVLMRGRLVQARVWRVEVGRVTLYLLDTNIGQNDLLDRWVTGHLYGGDRETRIVQEMMLGIGGVRLLRALEIEPQLFHLNEGHSAFLTLELARELIVGEHVSFAEAAESVREQCVFTTHTPVAAGNDEFDPHLVERCFGQGYMEALGLTPDEFFALGRARIEDKAEPFGLTPLALRMCRTKNGVSLKHGEVSRALWHVMWPERSVEAVPITHITNGVHAPTWVAPPLRAIYEKHVGENWAEIVNDPERWAEGIDRIPDEELWETHSLLKRRLVAYIRHRLSHEGHQHNGGNGHAEDVRNVFDPDALIIGFARRVAAYKRWNLLLTDPARLLRLINDAGRPVQFVFAGKAHPQDQGAKFILQQIALWRNDPAIRHRAVFLQDYDQEIARYLVQSVDVWMNVPRRPLEASGTSGQKVGMNGGLNLSILDGWWIEGYDGTNGWAVGDASRGAEIETDDARDAESLYHLLETEVAPIYYERDARGLPRRWVAMMKRAIQTLAPAFNSDRMVQEYTQKIYLEGNATGASTQDAPGII